LIGPFDFDEFYYGVVVVVESVGVGVTIVVELDGAAGGVTGDGEVVVVVFVVVVLGGSAQPAKAIIPKEQIPRAMSFECFIKREIKK
jgi:hypothetical protein